MSYNTPLIDEIFKRSNKYLKENTNHWVRLSDFLFAITRDVDNTTSSVDAYLLNLYIFELAQLFAPLDKRQVRPTGASLERQITEIQNTVRIVENQIKFKNNQKNLF